MLIIQLNNEQRKHLAVTLRTIGIGALFPVGLRLYGTDIPVYVVVIWSLIAIGFEALALIFLRGVTND